MFCFVFVLKRNIAGEASAFLKFIVDYYDALPPVMVFLHGHRLAYHQVNELSAGRRGGAEVLGEPSGYP